MPFFLRTLRTVFLGLMSLAITPAIAAENTEIATFAGGCFWSMQRHFDPVPGVVSTRVGYTGGPEVNPS